MGFGPSSRCAGMRPRSPMESIQVLTRNAARMCRIEGAGVIRPGADADLLALGLDPLERPEAIADVAGVYRAGRRVA